MQQQTFLKEHEVYELLKQFNIAHPEYHLLKDIEDLEQLKFAENKPVCLKGCSDFLWHKSDMGALKFFNFNKSLAKEYFLEISKNLKKDFPKHQQLLCEKVEYCKREQLPTEAFISIKRDSSGSMIITMGLGGLFTEQWNLQLKNGLLIWPHQLMTPEMAMRELQDHLLGKILFGHLRQAEPLISETTLLNFLKDLWKLSDYLAKNNIELLEINPFVIAKNQSITALDGVGLKGCAENTQKSCILPIPQDSLLRPKKIALAGVSSKPGSFGSIILNNLIESKVDNKNLLVIKPETKEFSGIPCIPDISALKDNSVDILILVLPGKISVALIDQLINQGSGASVVYLVAGGVGDGADQGLNNAKALQNILDKSRNENRWTPRIVGPNSLGIVLSPLSLNSLFITKEKMQFPFNEKGNVAFVSQSGAYFITRLSGELAKLPLKYGFCIGNQFDLKASEFLELFKDDKDIHVITFYMEGFSSGDLMAFSKQAKKLVKQGKHIVLYKGGDKSEQGQAAAAGHTGSMAGDSLFQNAILKHSQIHLCSSFKQFMSTTKWLSSYKDLNLASDKLCLISNAGYETVAGADRLGGNVLLKTPSLLNELNDSEIKHIAKILQKHQLDKLVSPANPLDLTPMANEQCYLDVIEQVLKGTTQIVLVGMVPLTERLETNDLSVAVSFGEKIYKLTQKYRKPVALIIDSGSNYDQYRKHLAFSGVPVFNSLEDALLIFP